jgi:hypothetical protein
LALPLLAACDPELREWERAQAEHSESAYRAFVEAFPESEHRPIADSLVQELSFSAAMESGTIQALRSFLESHGSGHLAGRADSAIVDLEFAEAVEAETIDALDAFLAQRADSHRAEEARALRLELIPDHRVRLSLGRDGARIATADISVSVAINGSSLPPMTLAQGAGTTPAREHIVDLEPYLQEGRNTVVVTIDVAEFEPTEEQYEKVTGMLTGFQLRAVDVQLLEKEEYTQVESFLWSFVSMGSFGAVSLGPEEVRLVFDHGH